MAQYERLPWFKFFVVDWLTDPLVCGLNFAQQGLFLKLLCIQWREGWLPSDLEQLRRLGGVGSGQWDRGGGDTEDIFSPRQSHADGDEFKDVPLYSFIEAAFPKNGDNRRNLKLETVREELSAAYEARAKGGKLTRGKPHKRKRSALGERTLSTSSAGVDIRSQISDTSLRDVRSGSPSQTTAHANENGRTGKRFWWDAEKKRIWGTDEARAALKAKWLERGLTAEEFQSQLASCDRWLADREGKRREASNLANRVNNWLNRYLTEQDGKARS